ncbi:DEGP1, partial [Symbiodinium pilosum]
LHCGAKGERNTVVDVSVGGSLLRGACDRSVYAVLKQDKLGIATALCRMVKLWAKRRRLTNTLKGGLSSFSFVLLTIFFLQQGGEANAAGQTHGLPPQNMVTGTKPTAANPEKCCPPPLGLNPQATEEELARLLLAFFNWAAEDLPRLQSFTLSVASAKAERRAGAFKPLVLAVPFAPGDNAARCLRADVW